MSLNYCSVTFPYFPIIKGSASILENNVSLHGTDRENGPYTATQKKGQKQKNKIIFPPSRSVRSISYFVQTQRERERERERERMDTPEKNHVTATSEFEVGLY